MDISEWHSAKIEELYKVFNSSELGLSRMNHLQNQRKYGLNELHKSKHISGFSIFIAQFKSFLIYILFIAILLSAILGNWIDAIVILLILIINAIVGFLQEYKAEKSIEELINLASASAHVIRDGSKHKVDVKDLVPGDIILLGEGSKVPADARLLEAVHLETQEASLTGESHPIPKAVCDLNEDTVLGERKNMVFAGTIITKGRAKALIVSTGMNSEIGKIAKMVQDQSRKLTPLQEKLEKFGKKIGFAVILVCLLVFLIGFIRGLLTGVYVASVLDLFMISVALAVAAVPEGLPVVVTISLALGTKRMLTKNALMRRLSSVETLGSVTVICSDKTGTFTKNEMTVKKIFTNNKTLDVTGTGYVATGQFMEGDKPINPDEIKFLLTIGVLNNDSFLNKDEAIGDPTEACLLVSAKKAGIDVESLRKKFVRIDELEFSSERKMMTTVHKSSSERIIFSKGAPDMLLERCDKIFINGKVKKLSWSEKKEILEVNNKFASEALRVLAFAYKEYDHPANYEKDLIFVGLQAMIDPPRDEVKKAVQECYDAGIKVVMITGDSENTARAIASQIGIHGKCVSGKDIEKINLDKEVETISIYARVNPAHKLAIIDALQKRGHIVAMTGDGVNDAPALKKADIGIAMGITGTEVSKEASDMVLVDDNFASIVKAVEEGRGVFDNIRKLVAFLLSGNIGEVLVIFLALLIGLPLPLVAIQLLLINLFTDGLPATALSADPFEPNSMSRKPRKHGDSLYTGLMPYLVVYPLLMTAFALCSFAWFVKQGDIGKAHTAAFLSISLFELYQAFSCRSLYYPAWKVGIFKNKWLNIAVLNSFVILLLVVFVPALNLIFHTSPLSWFEFGFILIGSSLGGVYLELNKYINTR